MVSITLLPSAISNSPKGLSQTIIASCHVLTYCYTQMRLFSINTHEQKVPTIENFLPPFD
jgi:hypothetical protein